MKFFRFLFWLVVVVGLLVAGVAAAARLYDGPIAAFPGGPFQTGEFVEDPNVDWSFAQDRTEMQLESDGRSRTVWLLVKDGVLYVPASVKFPPGKSWHLRALDDPRAVVRIDGKRYRRDLERVEDPDRLAALHADLEQKYGRPPGSSPEDIWVFKLAAPSELQRGGSDSR
jgi:hypothetical protein